jgi:rhamnose utilization protein RhaD (predicted bifunctional aldolase and dehydrogenase)
MQLKEWNPSTEHAGLDRLRDLASRVGADPLLTQASTGNMSIKLDGVLWIKASGKWMADALREDIVVPLELPAVLEYMRRNVDPSARFHGASLETALHAALPHRVVLHVHCVDTIAWAVRGDGPVQLRALLHGLSWKWVPYTPSGLALSRAMERVLSEHPGTDVFVLANHGLVIGGDTAEKVEALLADVRRRLAIRPRVPHPADYAALWGLSKDSSWELPEDDMLHALGTDPVTGAILAGGVLCPCQAIFSAAGTPAVFRPVPCPQPGEAWQRRYSGRPFLVIEGRGVLVSTTIAAAELAMVSGLAQVVQRLPATAPLRYLSNAEIAGIPSEVADRYRQLAATRRM